MDAYLIPIAITALFSLFGWLLRRVVSQLESRVQALETSRHKHAEEFIKLQVKEAAHEVQIASLIRDGSDLTHELKEIRENMVRRQDLDSMGEYLSKRIDDAINRNINKRD